MRYNRYSLYSAFVTSNLSIPGLPPLSPLPIMNLPSGIKTISLASARGKKQKTRYKIQDARTTFLPQRHRDSENIRTKNCFIISFISSLCLRVSVANFLYLLHIGIIISPFLIFNPLHISYQNAGGGFSLSHQQHTDGMPLQMVSLVPSMPRLS